MTNSKKALMVALDKKNNEEHKVLKREDISDEEALHS